MFLSHSLLSCSFGLGRSSHNLFGAVVLSWDLNRARRHLGPPTFDIRQRFLATVAVFAKQSGAFLKDFTEKSLVHFAWLLRLTLFAN